MTLDEIIQQLELTPLTDQQNFNSITPARVTPQTC